MISVLLVPSGIGSTATAGAEPDNTTVPVLILQYSTRTRYLRTPSFIVLQNNRTLIVVHVVLVPCTSTLDQDGSPSFLVQVLRLYQIEYK